MGKKKLLSIYGLFMYKKIDISISNLFKSKSKINHFSREIYLIATGLPEKFFT